MPEFSGVHHVALSVTDLAASENFYSRLLSIEPVKTFQMSGFERSAFRVRPGLSIGLTQHDAAVDAPFTPLNAGIDHIGLACHDLAALEEWVAHLDAVGLEHGPIVDIGIGLALVVKDPDQIPLEFFVPAAPVAS